MYATLRRYEGIDHARSRELTNVRESLLPSLSQLPGFGGYYLIDGAHESTRAAARWTRAQKNEQRFRRAMPETDRTDCEGGFHESAAAW